MSEAGALFHSPVSPSHIWLPALSRPSFRESFSSNGTESTCRRLRGGLRFTFLLRPSPLPASWELPHRFLSTFLEGAGASPLCLGQISSCTFYRGQCHLLERPSCGCLPVPLVPLLPKWQCQWASTGGFPCTSCLQIVNFF